MGCHCLLRNVTLINVTLIFEKLLLMAVLGLHCRVDFSLVAAAPVAVHWLLVGHGLSSTSSVVVAHGLSCSEACGIFPD